MKEGEIQREELIPPMFHCKEKYMEPPGNPVRFVELSLRYLSQQITVSHCLHTLRDNNVGTLDLIGYPSCHTLSTPHTGKIKEISCHIATLLYLFTHWWMSYKISPLRSNRPDRPSDPSIIQPTIFLVPQPLCHHYWGRTTGRGGGLMGCKRGSSGWRGCQLHFSLGPWQSLPGLV